jgi:hypothetical protein
MPAVNMGGLAVVPANPSLGKFVMMSQFSGPKNSPLDARVITGWVNGRPTYANDPTNYSTGALSTGIGFNASSPIFGPLPTSPQAIKDAGFTDNSIIGTTLPSGLAAAGDSRLVAIGGGRTQVVAGTGAGGNGTPANERVVVPQPYTAGTSLLGFGAGGSRDGGAGPVFTGFQIKSVTAAAAVVVGGVVETGFVNRAPRDLVTGESVFGSASGATATPS